MTLVCPHVVKDVSVHIMFLVQPADVFIIVRIGGEGEIRSNQDLYQLSWLKV